MTVISTLSPTVYSLMSEERVPVWPTLTPLTATITSPDLIPAFSAGLSFMTAFSPVT